MANQYTTILANLSGANNANGFVQWDFNQFDFITPRELVGYSMNAYYIDTSGAPINLYIPVNFVEWSIEIVEPLNVTREVTLNNSFPVGGTTTDLFNRLFFGGNSGLVGISPIPMTKAILRILVSSQLSIGFSINADLTLIWKAKKKLNFVGEK